MRIFIIICFCLGLNYIAHGQDSDTSYTEMTIQELQSVNPDALSKSDKKLYKKALKAAKKAENKRIKAKKKADRARKKAEKKRLKAEVKKRKKHNKLIKARIKLIETVQAKVWYQKDEFKKHGQFFGPLYPPQSKFLFETGLRKPWDYHMRTMNQADGSPVLQAIISLNATYIKDIYSGTGEPYYRMLMREANHYGYWQHYNRATLPGGNALQVLSGSKYLDQCTLERCDFREDVILPISDKMLTALLVNMQSIRIKISSSSSGAYHIVNLDPAYIVGFLLGVASSSDNGDELKQAAELAILNLKSQLQQ